MKKLFFLFLISCLFSSLFSFTQRYRDYFGLLNFTDDSYKVSYFFSPILKEYENLNAYGKKLILGERYIRIGPGHYSDEFSTYIINKGISFSSYAYDYTRYYKMGWFARFLLITEELTIKDQDGNILLTLEILTPEDFEVKEDYGDVDANLILDESSIEKWKERQENFNIENQQFGTVFNMKNESNKTINIEYSLSSMLTENVENQTYILDLGTNQISINSGLLQEEQSLVLEDESSVLISNYTYDYWKLNKMGWFAQFMLITGKFVVKDEIGNVILNLDTITPEDFEVTEENGITTATLVIRDKI